MVLAANSILMYAITEGIMLENKKTIANNPSVKKIYQYKAMEVFDEFTAHCCAVYKITDASIRSSIAAGIIMEYSKLKDVAKRKSNVTPDRPALIRVSDWFFIKENGASNYPICPECYEAGIVSRYILKRTDNSFFLLCPTCKTKEMIHNVSVFNKAITSFSS